MQIINKSFIRGGLPSLGQVSHNLKGAVVGALFTLASIPSAAAGSLNTFSHRAKDVCLTTWSPQTVHDQNVYFFRSDCNAEPPPKMSKIKIDIQNLDSCTDGVTYSTDYKGNGDGYWFVRAMIDGAQGILKFHNNNGFSVEIGTFNSSDPTLFISQDGDQISWATGSASGQHTNPLIGNQPAVEVTTRGGCPISTNEIEYAGFRGAELAAFLFLLVLLGCRFIDNRIVDPFATPHPSSQQPSRDSGETTPASTVQNP